MNTTSGKTPVKADVHARGLVANLLNSFLDKLGEALIGDFKSIFPEYKDDYETKKVSFKSGETPFKKEKFEGTDLILYQDYQTQEENNNTWGTEENPDENGLVNSKETRNQTVVADEGYEMSPKANSSAPNLTITYAPIATKGYEGYVIATAIYQRDGDAPEQRQMIGKKEQLNKWIRECKKEFAIGEDVEPEVIDESKTSTPASNQLIVTLQKVTGSTSYDIELTKINANYAISQAFDDLDAILADPDFSNSVPESETTYLIVPDDSGALDITELGEDTSSISDVYQQMINHTSDLLDYLRIACWGAKGAIRNDFMSAVESIRWSVESILNSFSEWSIIETKKVPQIQHSNQVVDIDNLTAVELAQDVQKKIEQYLETLDIIYVDLSVEQQARLNNFKDSIKSISEYSLSRTMLQ